MTSRGAATRAPSASTAASAMFATTRSAVGQRVGERVEQRAPRPRRRSPSAFASVASTDGSSMSTATTGPKPSRAAAIESTPEPQPTSSRLARGWSSRSSRQSRVVGCAPVPNARPGSITTASASPGGVLPRRPDPERADPDRAVELAPAILPAGLDLGRTARRKRAEHARGGLAVGGELDARPRPRPPRSPRARGRGTRARSSSAPSGGDA